MLHIHYVFHRFFETMYAHVFTEAPWRHGLVRIHLLHIHFSPLVGGSPACSDSSLAVMLSAMRLKKRAAFPCFGVILKASGSSHFPSGRSRLGKQVSPPVKSSFR